MNFKKIAAALTAFSILAMGMYVPEMPELASVSMMTATASEQGTTGNFTYQKFADHVDIIDYDKTAEDEIVTVPDEIDGIPVTGIGYKAFAFDSVSTCPIKEIILPDSVTNIDDYAFEYCKNLEKIHFPASLYSIGDYAFNYCNALQELQLPEGLVTIGTYAFSGCKALTSVSLPSTLKFIGSGAYNSSCTLEELTIAPENPYFKLVNNVLMNTDETIIYKASNALTGDFEIPDTVTTICSYAFYGCTGLTGVTFGAGITSIPDYAFAECRGLEEVTLPKTVSNINGNGLWHIAPFAIITIENPYCKIGYNAFATGEYTDENGEIKNTSSFLGTLKGYDNSTAESYALDYKCAFESLGVSDMPDPATTTTAPYTTATKATNAPMTTMTTTRIATMTTSSTQNIESVSDGTLKYTVHKDQNYATVVGLEKADAEAITIPAEINGVPVTGISYGTFRNSGITSVSVPDTITSIPSQAFYRCENLTNIDLPSGLIEISSEAFKACTALQQITLPDTLTTIGSLAFEGAGLTEIIIPGSVSNVTGFYGCHNLTNVVIQEGATAISYDAFACCRNLTDIILPSTLTNINTRAFASCDALESIALPESLTTIYSYAFAGCKSLKEIVLPDSLTKLDAFVFQQCTSLESVTLSKGMTSLDMRSLNRTAIKELTIPETITSIQTLGSYESYSTRSDVIYDLPELMTIYVDENNPNYESENGILFRKSSAGYSSSRTLEMFPPARTGHYTIPTNIYLSTSAFYQSRLSTITLARDTSLTSGNPNPFADCPNLTDIEIPAANTHVYEEDGIIYQKYISGADNTQVISLVAFPAGRDTESFVIPDGVTRIESFAFKNCVNLKSITIPDSVTTIGRGTFKNSGLTEITIPDSVITENQQYSYSSPTHMFQNCKNLKTVKLSDNMQIISDYMFQGCTALESIILPKNLEQIQNNAFANAGNHLVLDIPEGTHTVYSNAFQNAGLISIQFPDSVTALSSGMFRNCTTLTSVRLPASITAIPESLFAGCTALEEITIPEGVLEIKSNAFQNCTSLASVSLPDSLMNIYTNAFQNCSALEEIAIPANVSGIEQIVETTAPPATSEGMSTYATKTTATTTIAIGDTPTVPSHANAFPGCDALKNFVVSKDNEYYADIDGVLVSKDGTEIRQYPAGRTGSYEIPAGVTKIASNAFLNDKLSGIVIPDSMEEIGSNVFKGCENLADVTLPDNLNLISYGMFQGCTALKQITLPGQVKTINSYAFYQTSLTDVKLPESVENVYFNACGGTDLLKEITFLNPNCIINSNAIAGYRNPNAIDEEPFVSDEPDFDAEYSTSQNPTKSTAFLSLKSLVTVYGYDNSSAQKFAEEKKYPFKSLGESPIPIIPEETTASSADMPLSSTTTTTITTTSEEPPASTMLSTPQTTETVSETAPETFTTSVTTTTTISEIIPDETTSPESSTTEIIAGEITGYEYQITGKDCFCFADDAKIFEASDLIAKIQRRAVYSDDSTGEWTDFTDWESLDFRQQNPASVFETWNENQYSAVISVWITDILPDGTESVQELETGSVYIAMRGDIDLSNTVNASTAANILVYVAEKGSGLNPDFNPEYDETTEEFAGFLADVNHDGDVNASDAACILVYASIVGSKGACDWETEVFQSN